MPAPRKLTVGSIIEIVQTDHDKKIFIRRVRVRRLNEVDGRYAIVGENLKGKNGESYTLPRRAVRSPLDQAAGSTNFIFSPQGPSDE